MPIRGERAMLAPENKQNSNFFNQIELLRILDATNKPLSLQDIKEHVEADPEFVLEEVLASMVKENYVVLIGTSGKKTLITITLAGRKKVNHGIMVRHL
jgi:hypothetical protein